MAMMYDYIVVGGGPSGLTLATYLPGSVALVERHTVLGGCHRSDPSEGQFVEHGPRVYSGAYKTVRHVLRDIGLEWDEVFQKIAFSPEHIDGKRWYQWLSVKEIAWLSYEYIVMAFFNADHGRSISMHTYCTHKGFSSSSLAYIDMVCRFSDGAGSERYSLWEFLNGLDQHSLPFYTPRRPNTWLFDRWHAFLTARGVDTYLGSNVTSVSSDTVVLHDGSTLCAKRKIILCLPPYHASALVPNVPGFRDFALKTKYDMYWSVSFFGVSVDNSSGQRTTPWGVVALQYPFGVVSASASKCFVKSPVTGKTVTESKPEEVAKEIARQLGFPDTVDYAYSKSKFHDQAFVASAGAGYIDFQLTETIDSVGCHNGYSTYNFTSMEAAVQNALTYLGRETQTTLYVNDYVRWSIILCLVVFLVRQMK